MSIAMVLPVNCVILYISLNNKYEYLNNHKYIDYSTNIYHNTVIDLNNPYII